MDNNISLLIYLTVSVLDADVDFADVD